MQWLSVKIYTTREGIEPLTGRLYCLGVGGVQIEDSEDFAEFIESGQPHWDYIDESLEYLKSCETSVTAYLTDDAAGAEQLSLIREGVNAMKALDSEGLFGRLKIEVLGRDDEEWVNNWKQYYKPFAIGEKLMIIPEWDRETEEEACKGRIALVMNPGHLFGTGTHYSTKMCLETLQRLVGEDDRVLDLGCGSGILGIAALLLGAKSAMFADIDASAPNVVSENAELNCIGRSRYDVKVGNVLDSEFSSELGENYDIVVANIVADVIKALAPAAYAKTRNGGRFVCSGIIEEREDEVLSSLLDAGFELCEKVHDGGWSCLIFTK